MSEYSSLSRDELESRLAKAEKEISRLTAQNINLTEKLSEARETNDELMAEIEGRAFSPV